MDMTEELIKEQDPLKAMQLSKHELPDSDVSSAWASSAEDEMHKGVCVT